MRNALLSIAVLTLLLSLDPPRRADAQAGSGFTAHERASLVGGELVRRDLSRIENGRMTYGGASWQRIDLPIETVWARATEVDALAELIPSVDDARLVSSGARDRVVRIHHSYGIGETAYHVRMHLEPASHSLTFELDGSRPHDIRAGRGHLALSPYRGGTIVEWGMVVDPGAGLVMELFGPMLGEWLLLPPRCLRDDLRGAPSC